MNKEGLLLNFMLIYLMVNKHNKEILRNFKLKSDFPDDGYIDRISRVLAILK